jgi:hypothetical protein
MTRYLSGLCVAGAGLGGVSVADANPGERAAELISELHLMLEPLLAATGGQSSSFGDDANPRAAVSSSSLPRRERFASERGPG